MTKVDEGQLKFSERIAIIAVGFETNATMEEIAAAVGVSRRQLYTITREYEGQIKALRPLIRPVIKINKREINRVAVEKAQEEFEKRLGHMFAALDTAMLADDPRTALEGAKEGFNRLFGKSMAHLQVGGRVLHAHAHVTSAAALSAFDDDLARDSGLLKTARRLTAAPEQSVIEAEFEELGDDDDAN